MRNKKIWISILLTLFINILCLPLWTEYDYGSFVRTLFNKEAQLDLLYHGKITGAEPFTLQSIPKPFYTTWKYEPGVNVHRNNLNLRAREKWQKTSLQLKALRNGKITMIFRGPDKRDDYGHFYSVLIDWKNCKINGKDIFSESKPLSYQESFSKQISVRKDEILHIEAEFRRHHFTVHDFTRLKSGMVWYIITGNLFFFFLTYRLFSVIRGGGIRRGDAFLLGMFFLCLFAPMIGISDGVRSVREGRMLAVKPELKDIFIEKSDYGKRCENWFNDHFRGRVFLMKVHDVLRNKLSYIIRTEKAIYFKENGWDFLLPLISDLDCRPSSLQSIVQNIIHLNEFCQQHRIKFYVLEVPKKELVYKELIKENYGFDEKKLALVSQAQDSIRNEVRKHQIPYIYPYKALRTASNQDFVFFKCSHHWTDWGAFVGYRELMKEISKDFLDMPSVSLGGYRKVSNQLERDEYERNYRPVRHLEKYFNIGDMYDLPHQDSYPYYDSDSGDEMTYKIGKFIKEFGNPTGKHKVMLIGTSQNENFLQFLPYCAAQTKYIRVNGRGQVKAADEFKILKLYKKDILTFKPDILILSIHTNDLPSLINLCSTK